MNRPTGARVLPFLLRSERVLRDVLPEEAAELADLITEVRTLPALPIPEPPAAPLPPLRRFKRPAPAPAGFDVQEAPTRPDRAKPKPLRKKHLRLVPPPAPAPVPTALVPIETRKEAPPDPLGERMREAEGARALLLEIVRRAAYDWVLYRSSTRIDQKILAEDAYTWLFVEDEDHAHWKVRRDDGKLITGFVAICDALDLDVSRVRKYIRALTPNRVMSSGRPPENSRASDHNPHIEVHTKVSNDAGGTGESIDFDALITQLMDYGD